MDKMDLNGKGIALFFSYRLSLKTLHASGILSRESKIWEIFGKNFNRIYFITYGDNEETNLTHYFPKVDLLNNKWQLNPFIYTLFIPFLYRKELLGIDTYKVNQLSGALPAVISTILYRKKLIIRCGYQLSLFFKKQKESKIKILFALILEKISYFFAKRIIVTSPQDKEYIIIQHRIVSEKIVIIPNGIDTELFNILKDVKKEPGRILFVGRLIEQKNLFSLLEAVRDIKDAHLIIIGIGYLKDKLVKKVKEERINVTFIDSVNNNKLPIEYNKSEVFVLPSLFEGNPKVLLEAMACGTIVIGSNVVGINSIIKNRINGILCNPTSEKIRDSIVEVLNNRASFAHLANNARRDIEEIFGLYELLEKEIKSILQDEDSSYSASL